MYPTHLQRYKRILAKRLSLVLLSLLFGISIDCFSQGKQANIWYFGWEAGLDFNNGTPPEALTDGQLQMVTGHGYGSASIADTNGNLLFYSHGGAIWNKNHEYMENGLDLGGASKQGALIVPMPNSNHLYYHFNWGNNEYTDNTVFKYSIIDMTLDNGLGAVIEGKKGINLIENTSSHFSGIKNANSDSIWVVTHSILDDEFYSFLITEDSLITTPVISNAGTNFIYQMDVDGSMNFSPNGKYLSVAIRAGWINFFEILKFDKNTGIVSDENMIHKDGACEEVGFSPDNTKMYAVKDYLYQYDLEAGSPQEILNSEIKISDVYFMWPGAIQLGPDGKMYCGFGGAHEYLSVINQPNELGTACDFEEDAIYLEGKQYTGGLPTFVQSFLNDPEFVSDNNCAGQPTEFSIVETNGIDSVFWKFNDFQNPGYDTSTLFNPSYTFSGPGTYNVELMVYSGLLEKTVTQQVTIYPLPEPDLGNDTAFCDMPFSLTLNPNCSYDMINWSTGQFGVPEITVTDTGQYWVNVNKNGCSNRDTIAVGLYEKPVLDTGNVNVINPGCGYANGGIWGIGVYGAEPFSYYWLNEGGDTIAQTLDADSLAAGTYSLVVTDSNGCTNTLASFTLQDDGMMPVDSVLATNDHCTQALGSLHVFAPQIGTQLSYSIDSGYTWQQNGGVYDNLSPGSYYVMVKDENDCSGVFENNPVVLQNIPGPELTSVSTQNETNYMQDGQILLQASIQQGALHYSIDNGNNFQSGGLFTGLSAGTYLCMIKDDFGCDTTFEVIVEREFTTPLEAIAGDGKTCMGDVVVSPLLLDNFTEVKSFNVKLTCDSSLVQCDGYINLNSELEEGFSASLIPGTGDIYLEWEGENPLTLPENTTLTELVFTPLQDGATGLHWDTLPNMSVFLDEDGVPINVQYKSGQLRVYENPKIQPLSSQEFCQGDTLFIDPNIEGGNGQKTYSWTGPNGFTYNDSILYQTGLQLNQAGTYTLLVSDALNCQDESSLNITVNPQPNIAFSDYDTLFVEPGYELNAGSGQQSYLWNTGATTEYILIDSTGEYFVQVTSFKGCTSTDTVQILWSGEALFLPNAFTPNGDGLNDVFKPIARYDYVQDYHMLIYNRWGQMIFESTDLYKGWDGRLDGKPTMSGTYVYRIDYKEGGPGGESHTLTGTVVLVR